jgi:hypothetical protein
MSKILGDRRSALELLLWKGIQYEQELEVYLQGSFTGLGSQRDFIRNSGRF